MIVFSDKRIISILAKKAVLIILLISINNSFGQVKFISKDIVSFHPTSGSSKVAVIQLKKGAEVCILEEKDDGKIYIRYRSYKGFVTSDELADWNPLLDEDHRLIEENETVYVCHGSTAYAYHRSPNCHQIKKCSVAPKQYTRKEARGLCRTPCGDCY